MRDVRIAKVLVGQFVAVVILMACIELDDVWAEKYRKPLTLIDTISLVLCVVAELSLIRAAHGLLEGKRPHAKFWTMKALFIANTASYRITSLFITTDMRIGDLCYTSETLRAAYSGTVTALVAALVAVLASFSFVPKDLTDDPVESPASSGSSGSSGSGAKSDAEAGVNASIP